MADTSVTGRLVLHFRWRVLVLVLLTVAGPLASGAPDDYFVIEPYVTRVDARSAVFVWVTRSSNAPGTVAIQAAAGGKEQGVLASVSVPPFADREVPGEKLAHARNLARVKELQPFTPYKYRVAAPDGKNHRDGTFSTASEPGEQTPFTFAVISDTHVRHDAAAKALAGLDPHFIVHVGDFVEGRGHYWSGWVDFFDSARPYLQAGVIYPVLGGHDRRPDTNFRALFALDDIEGGFPDKSASYYSIVFGNLRYIMLDEYVPDSAAQLKWLEQVLAGNTATWTLASFHEPVFAAGSRGSMGGHVKYVELFERYGVDLVIYGHNHIYERMLPIGPAGGKPVHYVCINTRGNFRVVRPSPVLVGGIGRQVVCFAVFEVDGNRLMMTVKEPDGTMVDRLELVKEKGAYPPEIMAQALTKETAREIAHMFSAGGSPGKMYDRADIRIDLPDPPVAGKTMIARLDTKAFPRESRLHVLPNEAPGQWQVKPHVQTITNDEVVVELVPPDGLKFVEGGYDPSLTLRLRFEYRGRMFHEVTVTPTFGPEATAKPVPAGAAQGVKSGKSARKEAVSLPEP